MPTPNIGLSESERAISAKALNSYLSDVFVLSVKTKGCHWNMQTPLFAMLHKLFDEHYEVLSEAVDESAERLRKLGILAPASATELVQHAKISDGTKATHTEEMIKTLLADHETIIRDVREYVKQSQDEGHDEATADYFIGQLAEHEKIAWMLRASLQE